jgi:hypothetical protein
VGKADDIARVALGNTLLLLLVGRSRIVLGVSGNGQDGGEEDLVETHFGLARVLHDYSKIEA